MATITTTIKEPKTFQAIQEEEQQLGNNKLVENINKNIEKLVEISQNKREVKEDELDKQLKRNNLELSKLQIKKAQYGLAREEKAFSRPSANSNQSSITKSLGMSQSDTTSLGAVALGALTGINPAVLKTMKDTLHIDKVLTAPLKMAVGGLKSLGNMFQSSNRISGKTSTSIDDEPKDERLYDKLEEILSAIKEKSGTNKEEKESKPSKFKDFLKKLLLGALGAVALAKVAEAFSGQIKEAWDKLTNKVQKAIEEHPILTGGAIAAIVSPIVAKAIKGITPSEPKPNPKAESAKNEKLKSIKEDTSSTKKDVKEIKDEQIKEKARAEQRAKDKQARETEKTKQSEKLRNKAVEENTEAIKKNTKAVKKENSKAANDNEKVKLTEDIKNKSGKKPPVKNTKAQTQLKQNPNAVKEQPKFTKNPNAKPKAPKTNMKNVGGAGKFGKFARAGGTALNLAALGYMWANREELAKTVDEGWRPQWESVNENWDVLLDDKATNTSKIANGLMLPLNALSTVLAEPTKWASNAFESAFDFAFENNTIAKGAQYAEKGLDAVVNFAGHWLKKGYDYASDTSLGRTISDGLSSVKDYINGEETITNSEKAEKIEQYAANNQTYLKQTAEQITLLNQNLSKQQTQTPYVDGRTFNQQTIYQGQSFNYTPM